LGLIWPPAGTWTLLLPARAPACATSTRGVV
jgi:hypothetical protein